MEKIVDKSIIASVPVLDQSMKKETETGKESAAAKHDQSFAAPSQHDVSKVLNDATNRSQHISPEKLQESHHSIHASESKQKEGP